MLITPFKNQSESPRFRAQRTTGKLAAAMAQQPKAAEPPITPTGLGLQRILFNPTLSLNSKVAF